jgi:hypothetical protein
MPVFKTGAINHSANSPALLQFYYSPVFIDDNPVERGLVRKLLPQVAVPELPQRSLHTNKVRVCCCALSSGLATPTR